MPELEYLTFASIVLVIAELIGLVFALDVVMRPRSSQGTIAWFIALIAMPLITVPLYLLFGRTRFHGYAEAIRDKESQIGEKRKEISEKNRQQLIDIYTDFKDSQFCKIYPNEYFGYTKVTVEQPLIKKDVIVKDKKGNPKPDSKLRDNEKIPLKDDVHAYFVREVLPHVSDAWMDRSKDKVGYEISFTKYFYEYQPLRSLDEIKTDILALEAETEGLLGEILGEVK